MSKGNIADTAAVYVIFGATGDLAGKRIFPALAKLFTNNLLPKKFKVIACARTPHTRESFSKLISTSPHLKDKEGFSKLAANLSYLSVDLAENLNLAQITKEIDQFEDEVGVCVERIFYMAISPSIFEKAFENFGKNNLHLGCTKHESQPRIIIEKPFGRDLSSAQETNRILSKYFTDQQIYRIDHYLGKETVQNIFAFRFANEIFEPVWNNQYIDSMQITVGEHVGVEKRGEYFDKTGTLRDMIQNHLLQLLTLVTMDEPGKFEASSINSQKIKVLKNIKKMPSDQIVKGTVHGQYDGYLSEEKISKSSRMETYALVKLALENKRWQGVPFYLRTGKKLMGKVTSIIIQFKEGGHRLFENFWDKPLPNHITIQIQPNEGIGIRLAAKKPGLGVSLEPVDMEFCYKTSFDTPQPDAYERLLLEVIVGDQSLFLSQEIVEESWKIIDPIREVWDAGRPKLTIYKPGSWGPKEADDLIAKDGRHWLAPILTICRI